MSSLADLRPGDIAIGPIHGFTGAFVGAAQLALATVEPGLIWRQGPGEWFRKRHAGVITGTADPRVTTMVQAMPGGAEEIELRPETHWTEEWTYIRPRYAEGKPFEIGLENRSQGFKVARAAQGYVGTPYDFLTYAAIPPYRAGVRGRRIEHIISGRDTMMCSRLVDACLADAGYHLFDDGRLEGNVTPSELYRQLRRLPHQYMQAGPKGFGFVEGWSTPD